MQFAPVRPTEQAGLWSRSRQGESGGGDAGEHGRCHFTRNFTFTEGTGRFSGAGGGGNYHGRIDTNTGEVTAEIDRLLLR
jgi:hypothetical protein